MRPFQYLMLMLLLALGACGGGPVTTLVVTCGGSTVLAGAKSVDVVVDPVSKMTALSFPDPVNTGRTGTIAVQSRCTVVPKS